MTLKLVKANRLKHYGKLVKGIDGKKTLYLQEGIHTTIEPIVDRTNITVKKAK